MRQSVVEPAGRNQASWPPDDSEESVVGSEFHQRVIDGSRDGLDMASVANAAWWVQSQIAIGGFQRPDGSPYTMVRGKNPQAVLHAGGEQEKREAAEAERDTHRPTG